jgi:hypothetical protein
LRRGRNRVTAVTFTHVHRCIDVPTCAFRRFIICVAQAYGNVISTEREMCTCARSTTALIAGTRVPHIWQTHSMEQQSVREATMSLTARVQGHIKPPANPSRLAHTQVLLHIQTPPPRPTVCTTNQSTLFT